MDIASNTVAGVAAFLAIAALLLAGLFLALFFDGMGSKYGPLRDIFSAAGLLLLVMPALAMDGLVQGEVAWFPAVTLAAVTGMVLAALGQVLLVLRLVPLGVSFVTGGIGIAPVPVWMGAQVYTGLRVGLPSSAVGFFAFLVLVLVAASIQRHRRTTWVISNLLVTALSAYLAGLGTVLVRAG